MTVTGLFLCAGILAGGGPPQAGDQHTQNGWVLVRKPLYDLLPASRIVIPEDSPPQRYIKRSVGLGGETLPIQKAAVAGPPVIHVERIIVEGGKVEITAESIKVEGGRVEIIRRSGQ